MWRVAWILGGASPLPSQLLPTSTAQHSSTPIWSYPPYRLINPVFSSWHIVCHCPSNLQEFGKTKIFLPPQDGLEVLGKEVGRSTCHSGQSTDCRRLRAYGVCESSRICQSKGDSRLSWNRSWGPKARAWPQHAGRPP
jgi:hypothetical protein